jgi:alpha-beta hydrolase superfamily lysophospholipase
LMQNLTCPSGAGPCPPLNILYNHGSGENVASNYRMERYQYYLSLGAVRIFVYDYPGYGKSEGSPTDASVKASARAALAYFKTLLPPAAPVVFLGRSLGGGVASWLTKEVEVPHALMLQSTFANIADVATVGFPISGSHLHGLSACHFMFPIV